MIRRNKSRWKLGRLEIIRSSNAFGEQLADRAAYSESPRSLLTFPRDLCPLRERNPVSSFSRPLNASLFYSRKWENYLRPRRSSFRFPLFLDEALLLVVKNARARFRRYHYRPYRRGIVAASRTFARTSGHRAGRQRDDPAMGSLPWNPIQGELKLFLRFLSCRLHYFRL